MASGSDVRDILGLGAAGPSSATKPPPPKKLARPPGQKRLAGIARELHELLGGSAPPIVPVRPQYKAKPKMSKRVTGWVWRQFKNDARSDGLLLEHWEKVTDSQDEPYRFSKFNKNVNILEYSDDEYTKFLVDEQWSKEETDYLFKLCKQYELRFIIITDRYEFEDKQRSMEDLKDRYYTVVRKIAESRAESQPELRDLVTTHQFNKNMEVERKKHLERLSTRTPEQIKEEEILFQELRRREASEAKWTKEREHLAKTLGSMDIPIPTSMGGPSGELIVSLQAGVPVALERKESLVPVGRSILGELEDLSSRREKLPPGVFLRSSRLTAVKSQYQSKVNEVFERFDIPMKPVMPTGPICNKMEDLKGLIQQLLDMKRMHDRISMDMKSAIQRKQYLEMGDDNDDGGGGGRKRSMSSPAHSQRDAKRQRA
ncbi:hypothetical protein SmJEL517_g06254 [Synchytrium microbalum]|uniref:SWR1-complex protein 4 n=1 Tax=Synchytrium microbalum TaxID=1806994 RepID=A0A507BXM8_9FUNG|nr:uncharacterized protein SmJEL517_g06254 [Synchytrium microbalum]TPX30105.1 hypothetical protein SmJEL517_g06254 [Synchytrium microbalum]